ncbi:MAG: hypothetical protein ACE5MB_02850 [Anaerolineae bacterium]
MKKIIVDFEGHGEVLTAYECPEDQTVADLTYQTIEELEGFPLVHSVQEIVVTSTDQLSIPLDEKASQLLGLREGQKVESLVIDGKHLLVAVP